VDHNSAVIFEVNYSIPLNLAVLVPALILGALCGLLAVAFTNGNIRIIRWRRQFIKPFPNKRMLEPVIVVLIYVFFSYLFAIAGSCQDVVAPQPGNTTLGFQYWCTEKAQDLITFTCNPHHHHTDGTNTTFSPLATMMLSGGKNNIRHMFSRRTIRELPTGSVLLYLIMYFCFAMYTSGTAIASGLVIPTLVIGSLIGRLFGLLLTAFTTDIPSDATYSYLGGYYDSQSWTDPGVFAIIGAAAFFSGITRLAISIPVIMVELSGELHYLLPIIIAVAMSKAVADSMAVNLYHQQLHMDSVPFLPSEVHGIDLEQYTADSVASKDLVVLQTEEDTKKLVRILKQTSHHTFPVVEPIVENRSMTLGAKLASANGAASVPGSTAQLTTPQLDDELSQARSLLHGPHKFVGTVTRGDLEILIAMALTNSSSPLSWTSWQEHKHYSFQRKDGIWMWILSRVAPQPGTTTPPPPATSLSAASASARDEASNVEGPTTGSNKGKISLVPIINWSPWTVPKYFNLQMTYLLFRTMGLRHLIVLEGESVCGIITRKDLLPHRLHSLHYESSPMPEVAVGPSGRKRSNSNERASNTATANSSLNGSMGTNTPAAGASRKEPSAHKGPSLLWTKSDDEEGMDE
jgi:hypothetical protein